jgi:hypothetical protein
VSGSTTRGRDESCSHVGACMVLLLLFCFVRSLFARGWWVLGAQGSDLRVRRAGCRVQGVKVQGAGCRV